MQNVSEKISGQRLNIIGGLKYLIRKIDRTRLSKRTVNAWDECDQRVVDAAVYQWRVRL